MKEQTKYLLENKELLIEGKKSQIKKCDAIFNSQIEISNPEISKALPQDDEKYKRLTIVANTTNYMDSHNDVHIKGLWKKTLRENKKLMFLNQHQMNFENLLAKNENVKAYTQLMTWQQLGYSEVGQTEALLADIAIRRSKKTEDIIQMYNSGEIDNHSVGMRYIKVLLAINDSNAPDEFEIWNKYIDTIINKERAIKQGFFYAVTEAKLIEISAVLMGSNDRTPVYSQNKNVNFYDINQAEKALTSLVEKCKPSSTLAEKEQAEKLFNQFLNKLN